MSETTRRVDVPPPQRRSLTSELLDRQRLLVMLGVLVIEFAIFIAALVTPLSGGEQQLLANQTSNQFTPIQNATATQQVVFIFSHNLFIALAEIVPVFGAFLFVFSVQLTGQATQAILASRGLPGLTGLILLVLPFSLVELSAYAIAVGSGVMLLWAAIMKRLRRELRVFAVEVVVIVAVLFTAAVMETVTNSFPIVGLALWIPTGLAIVGLMILASRSPR